MAGTAAALAATDVDGEGAVTRDQRLADRTSLAARQSGDLARDARGAVNEVGTRWRHVLAQAIAALVGVAPFNDDSGSHTGARHIRGGRSKVRVGLYQAAIAAIRHCPRMKRHYAALKARGKASRVAIIAVARKLLVLANALIRDMKPYQPQANSVC